MSFDLVIRGGTVVDGSGLGGYRADVGIVGDRIALVGRIKEQGAREIDADGLVVTPGFIDAHTHMDAQIFWDRQGSNSCWHGVTTVVMGNCGFTLAPVQSDARALVVRNLERAEDMDPNGARGGDRVELGDLPGVPRDDRQAAEGDQLRVEHRALGAAHVGDGRPRVHRNRDPRRPRADDGPARRRAARRRDRLHHVAEPAPRDVGRPAGSVTARRLARGARARADDVGLRCGDLRRRRPPAR